MLPTNISYEDELKQKNQNDKLTFGFTPKQRDETIEMMNSLQTQLKAFKVFDYGLILLVMTPIDTKRQ